MGKVCFSFISLMLSFCFVNGQKLSQEEYIAKYKELAMHEMKRSGIPASITLAQGILETESGNSPLLLRSNNHFGIKCKTNWTGPSVSHDDDERNECFRAYQTAEESYKDHSDFLKSNTRYAFLFDLDPADYKGWAEGLRKAGYATNPRYPEILIRYIETYHLQQYDSGEITEAPTMIANVKIAPESEVVKQTAQQVVPVEVPAAFSPFSSHEINKLKALYAPAGTSLLVIAVREKIKLSRLLEYNDLKKDGILARDQFIFLERKKAIGSADYYVTLTSETPYSVAQITGVQLQNLLSYNGYSENEILSQGTRVYLKPGLAKVTALQSGPLLPGAIKNEPIIRERLSHEVQPKEGLYSISKRYGVSVDQLKNWNNLPDNNLKIGQRLNILK